MASQRHTVWATRAAHDVGGRFQRARVWTPAAAVGSATLIGIALITRRTTFAAVSLLAHDPAHMELFGTLELILLVAVPLAVSAVTAFAVWELGRFAELARYLRAVHRYLDASLRTRSALTRLGYAPGGLPFGPDGAPRASDAQPLSTLLDGKPGTLLLGETGSGKTVALRRYALEMTRRRHLLAVGTGRKPVPIVASLAGYAASPSEGGGPRMRYLARQIETFASPRFANWLLTVLSRRNVVLVLDGMDEVPAPDRASVASELARFLSAPYGRVRLVISCGLLAYTGDPSAFTALSPLRRVVAECPDLEAITVLLDRAGRSAPGAARAARVTPLDKRLRPIGGQISQLSTLAALAETLAANGSLPTTRGHALVERVNLMLRAAAGGTAGLGAVSDITGAHAAAERDVITVLGHLALALRAAETTLIPLLPDTSVGEAVARWLDGCVPLVGMPTLSTPPAIGAKADSGAEPADTQIAGVENIRDTAPDPASDQLPQIRSITRAVTWATDAGLLERLADGTGMRFAERALCAACAAGALAVRSDDAHFPPFSPLPPGWYEPILLWAGITERPALLAGRILRVVRSDPSRVAGDGSEREIEAESATTNLALALAIGLEGFGTGLLRVAANLTSSVGTREDVERIQEHLRDLFDRVSLLFTDRGRRSRFAAALAEIERVGGADLIAHLSTIATCGSLSRLVRAQAITVLGASTSSAAIDALVALLGESDPVIRQAVDDALLEAGAKAVGPLRAAMSSADDHTRARASEALSRGGSAALSAALASLEDSDAAVRAAAARALGAIGAPESLSTPSRSGPRSGSRNTTTRRRDIESGVEALHGHLDDPNGTVRVACAWAIGRIGSRRSVPILASHMTRADPDLRAAIAEAFGTIHQAGTLDPLITLLDDPDARVRVSAAEALGRLGDARAIPPLRQRLADGDPWSKAAATAALRLLLAYAP